MKQIPTWVSYISFFFGHLIFSLVDRNMNLNKHSLSIVGLIFIKGEDYLKEITSWLRVK